MLIDPESHLIAIEQSGVAVNYEKVHEYLETYFNVFLHDLFWTFVVEFEHYHFRIRIKTAIENKEYILYESALQSSITAHDLKCMVYQAFKKEHRTFLDLMDKKQADFIPWLNTDKQSFESTSKPVSTTNWQDHNGNPDGGIATGFGFTIAWQRGQCPTPEYRNGAFLIEVIDACSERLKWHQSGAFACPENAEALQFLQRATVALRRRRLRRKREGTLGMHVPETATPLYTQTTD